MRGILLKDRPKAADRPRGKPEAAAAKRRVGFGKAEGGLLLSCLVLAGAGAVEQPLPLAACALLCVEGLFARLAALLGAGAGYLLRWGWSGSMEPLALLGSCFAAGLLFRGTEAPRWLLGAGLSAVVCGVFLIDTGIGIPGAAHLLLCVVLSAAAPEVMRRAWPGEKPWAVAACGCFLLLGLAGTLSPLGPYAAAALSFAVLTGSGDRQLPAAGLCGLSLDLCAGLPLPMTGALVLAALGLKAAGTREAVYRVAIPAAVLGLWQLFLGRFAPGLWLCAGLGAAAGTRLPAELLPLPRLATAPVPAEPVLLPQRGVERALRRMHRALSTEAAEITPTQLAEVYDYAEAQVCRCCVHSARCWEQNAEDTYRDLCSAGGAMLLRGTALREDLPNRFTARCCHTEGFLTAVNQALDAAQLKRREERRLAEGRKIAADQYLFLARLLRRAAEPPQRTPLRYRPELAVGAAPRAGETVSGDRGATCRDPYGHFYVLLCDGMGSGVPAKAESDRAAHLLTDLLESGAEPDSALALLNDFYALRAQSAFATVDLLRLDLRTGEGTLYKWGAAPSYLRTDGETKKIGTGTPPPGLEAGALRAPGQYALSLKEGETLVMVSDGAFGPEAEQVLEDLAYASVRDLASCLITLGSSDTGDDRTAIVLRLRAENLKTA